MRQATRWPAAVWMPCGSASKPQLGESSSGRWRSHQDPQATVDTSLSQ